LERALGIKMERIRPDGTTHQPKERVRPNLASSFDRPASSARPSMVMLPGEVLQAQMEA
jgi:hypothetical protein